jgi:molecular chaperone DnaK (HSP70)
MLSKLKDTTEEFIEAPVSSCVVSCPGWWAHKQRKALMHACTITDLSPLRVVNDLSAVAFNYGFYHPNIFGEKASHKIMFVSLGHLGFQCNVVEFTKPCCTVKGVAYDLSLGGYLLDELLADHFATRFNQKNHVDIKDNKRVMLKILLAMEAVKKTLNTNPQASINQDCIYEGLDLQDKILKDEYHEILNKNRIPERVVECVKRCLAEAKTEVSELHSIEWVGSGMRVQAIRDCLSEFLGKPLSSTMNAEEATAMVCF